MAATITTVLLYPKTDTATGVVNDSILKQEIEDEGIANTVNEVLSIGTDVRITLEDILSSSDKTAIDGVIAAHQGSSFDPVPIYETDNSETSDDSGSDITKVTLSAGPLSAGTYIVTWAVEHKLNTGSDTTGSRASFTTQKGSDSEVERYQDTTNLGFYQSFAGSYPITVLDGESYAFRLKHQRVGASGNASYVQRASLTLRKDD